MRRHHTQYACWALVALGAVAALVAAAARVRVERGNRTVALVLDYDQIAQLSAVSGLPPQTVAHRLFAAGATDAALTESTIRDVMAGGEVALVPVRVEDSTATAGAPTAAFLGPHDTISRMGRSITQRLGQGAPLAGVLVDETPVASRLNLYGIDPEETVGLGIGYARAAVQTIRSAGLGVVPRPRAEGNQWAAASAEALELADDLDAKLVIFSGNAALGYPSDLQTIAIDMASRDLTYGYVEFGKQYGDMALAAKLPHEFVRVHSINETEMLGMSRQRALDRFALAVQERNVRACYVRLFAPSGPDPVESAEAYLRALAERLRAAGFELDTPKPFPELSVSPWLRAGAMAGALAAVALCVIGLLDFSPTATLIALAVGIGLACAGTAMALEDTAKLCALLGAIALPTYAVARHRPPEASAGRWGALARGLGLYALAAGISLLGGLFVVGCLADSAYMVKLDQFRGVKLAQMVPLAAVILLLVGHDLGEGAPGESPMRVLVGGWRKLGEAVVRYWHLALIVVGVAGLGIMIMRSGNDSGLGVSGLELRFRAAMDHVFGVRPRTKEVLIGYPLLLLGLARAASGKTLGRWVLLSIGAIGLVSMVNTFSHLHTPVEVSLIRTLHGLWAGALVGLVLYIVTEVVEGWVKQLWLRLNADS